MTPVFIFGAGRSGTTMLGGMLGTAARALCVPEAQFIQEGLVRFGMTSGPSGPMVDFIANHPRFRIWSVEMSAHWRRKIPATSTFRNIVEHVVQLYATPGSERPDFWVEHAPGKITDLPLLAQAFPDAVFLHVVRDGRAVAASMRGLDWGPQDVLSAARYWCGRLNHAERGMQSITARKLTVRYEDLVRDARTALTPITQLAGLVLPAGPVSTAGFRPPGYTTHQHALVGKAPDPSRLEGWRHTLTMAEIATFEYHAHDSLTHHGYTLVSDGRCAPSEVQRIAYMLQGAWRKLRNKPRRIARQYKATRE